MNEAAGQQPSSSQPAQDLQQPGARVTVPNEPRRNYKKIILILLAIIIIVGLAELGYKLFNKTKKETTQTPSESAVNQDTPEPTQIPQKQIGLNSDFAQNFAQSLDLLSTKQSFVSEASTQLIVEGRVVNSGVTDINTNGLHLVYYFKLENGSSETLTFYLSEKEFEVANPVLTGTAIQSPLALSEIKKGDNLRIIQYKDLLEQSPDATRISIEVKKP